MRERKHKKTFAKLGLLFTIILFLLASVSMSYAVWTDTITIQGTITTAEDFNYICLEGYWKFNENTRQTAYDSSFNTNDGQLGSTSGYDDNDPTWTTGHSGTDAALDFDGNNDYVEVPDDDSLDITDEITIMAWVKPVSTNSNWPTVVAKWSGSSYYELYWLGIQNHKIGAEITTDDGNFYRETSDVVTLNEWQHLAMSYDSSTSVFRIYRNGNLIQEWTDVSGIISTSPKDLTIGVVKRSSNHHYFNGIIDEVKIYSCALDASEIWDEYQAGS